MKIRQGFVSNSSSSSFVCDVCGNASSGWDMGLEEAEMYECTNGHTFCEDHISGDKVVDIEAIRKFCIEYDYDDYDEGSPEEAQKMDDEELIELSENLGYFENERYDCSPSICPICNFLEMQTDDMCKYLIKMSGMTKSEILTNLKEEFSDYKKFKTYLEEK